MSRTVGPREARRSAHDHARPVEVSASMSRPPTFRARRRRLHAAVAAVAALVVLLAACGAAAGPTPTLTPTPTPTPRATPSPTAVPAASPSGLAVSARAQAYLVALDGFAYQALPAVTEQSMALGFTSNAVSAAAFRGYAATAVTRDGTTVAMVLVLDLDPSLSGSSVVTDAFWGGAAGSLGASDTDASIAGQQVHRIDAATTKIVGWQADELMVMVFGADLDQLNGVAGALIEAHA